MSPSISTFALTTSTGIISDTGETLTQPKPGSVQVALKLVLPALELAVSTVTVTT